MELYWLLRLPEFNAFFTIISVISMIASVFIIMAGITFLDEDEALLQSVNLLKWTISIAIITGFFSCFFPSSKDIALMLGWDAINSDSVQEVIELLKEKIK